MLILFKVSKGLQIGLCAQFQFKGLYLIKHSIYGHHTQQRITLIILLMNLTVCSFAFGSKMPVRVMIL